MVFDSLYSPTWRKKEICLSVYLCLVFVTLCITYCPFWFSYHLDEEEKDLIVLPQLPFMVLYDYLCYVTLPCGAVGWSALCDCGSS